MKKSSKKIISYRTSLVNRVLRSLKKEKPVVLFGPTGSGKTAIASAILDALETKAIVLEGSSPINPSRIPRSPVNLDGECISVQIDNVDRSTDGNLDVIKKNLVRVFRSGKKIEKVETVLPLIMTANDDKKIKKFELGEICDFFKVKPLDSMDIQSILCDLSESISAERAREISIACNGNIRAAISALNGGTICRTPKYDLKTLTKIYLSMGEWGKKRILEEQNVGVKGKGVSIGYFISLISRNVTDPSDFSILESASACYKRMDVAIVKNLLSLVNEERKRYIKFPKKVKQNDAQSER